MKNQWIISLLCFAVLLSVVMNIAFSYAETDDFYSLAANVFQLPTLEPSRNEGVWYLQSLGDNWSWIQQWFSLTTNIFNPLEAVSEMDTYAAERKYLFYHTIQSCSEDKNVTLSKAESIPKEFDTIDKILKLNESAFLQHLSSWLKEQYGDDGDTTGFFAYLFNSFCEGEYSSEDAADMIYSLDYHYSMEQAYDIVGHMEVLRYLKDFCKTVKTVKDVKKYWDLTADLINIVTFISDLDLDQLNEIGKRYVNTGNDAQKDVGKALCELAETTDEGRLLKIAGGRLIDFGVKELVRIINKKINLSKPSVVLYSVVVSVFDILGGVDSLPEKFQELQYASNAFQTNLNSFQTDRAAFLAYPNGSSFRKVYFSFLGYCNASITAEEAYVKVVEESQKTAFYDLYMGEPITIAAERASEHADQLKRLLARVKDVYQKWSIWQSNTDISLLQDILYDFANVPTLGISLDSAHFPDEAFLRFIKNYFSRDDLDENNKLRPSVIAKTKSFDCRDWDIKDLTGVEYFTSLEELICSNNQITKLDLSKNRALKGLWCDNNLLTELDLSQNTYLTSVNCDNNLLTELDLRCNTGLRSIYCSGNQLVKLDFSNKQTLYELNCSNNHLTELIFSNITSQIWYVFDCSNNYLTNLDVSDYLYLESLSCNDNHLTELNIKNCVELKKLICHNNQLAALDVTETPYVIVHFRDLDSSRHDAGSYWKMEGKLTVDKKTTALIHGYSLSELVDFNIYWTLDQNYVLTVYQGGDFPPNNAYRFGWMNYAKQITAVIMREPIHLQNYGYHLFDGYESCVSMDLSGLDTSASTSMEGMFYNCKKLEEVNLSSFHTSNVASMYRMFYGCERLRKVDFSSFDTSHVTSMGEMFLMCNCLEKVKTGTGFSLKGSSGSVMCTLPDKDWISAAANAHFTAWEIAENRNNTEDIYTAASASHVLHLPAGTSVVESRAFSGIGNLTVYVPAGIRAIADDAFDRGTVFVFANDRLAAWAESNGYDYIITK